MRTEIFLKIECVIPEFRDPIYYDHDGEEINPLAIPLKLRELAISMVKQNRGIRSIVSSIIPVDTKVEENSTIVFCVDNGKSLTHRIDQHIEERALEELREDALAFK